MCDVWHCSRCSRTWPRRSFDATDPDDAICPYCIGDIYPLRLVARPRPEQPGPTRPKRPMRSDPGDLDLHRHDR